MTRSLVLLSLAALFASPLAGAQQPPSTLLPGDGAIAPAAGNQSVPALAAGGDMVLAVWQDARSTPLTSGQQSSEDIFAVRLDAQGALLDPLPIPVSMAGGIQKAPRVAWNGSAWLVAWVGQVSTEFYFTDALLATRIAADGTLLDPVPLVIQPDMAGGSFGDVASDGVGWAVFFTGWSGTQSLVYGARVAADGTLPDPTPKVIVSTGGSPYTPYGATADWANGRYLVAWSQWSSTGQDNVRGRLVDAALAPVVAAFNVATSTDYEVSPDVASNGSQFFVVWDRYNSCCIGGASKACGTRVTTAGAVLDGPIGVAIYDTGGYGFSGCEPSVAWDGVQWVTSWTQPVGAGLEVDAARISPAGVVLDFNGFPVDQVPPRQEASAVVGLPAGGSLVAWQDSRVNVGQSNDIYTARLSLGGVSTPLGPAALGAPEQVFADGAAGPQGGALLVWTSMISGSTRVLGQPVTAQGAPLGLPIELGTGATLQRARAAWSGSLWLVTWDGPGGVFARRLGADGVPLGAAPFFVMPGFAHDVAAQGELFLVTALVPEANPEYVDVLSRRVDAATGTVLDGSSVLVGGSFATAQSVEGFDGGFLVAWERHPTHDSPYSSVNLRLVSTANVPGTQTALASASSYNQLPVLASSGGQALVAWQHVSIAQDVVARLVGPGLSLPGGLITVSAAAYEQQRPALAWDGEQYFVVWQDTRATQDDLFDKRTDIYAARVTADGAVLDPAGQALATDAVPEAWPAVAPLGVGSVLVAWSDFQPQAPYAGYRVALSLPESVSPWLDLGQALAGSGGSPPLLTGTGDLVAGSPASVVLSDAAPLAPTTLVVGLSQLAQPFKGGVLVPNPDLSIVLVTGPTGGLSLTGSWPAGVPSGAQIWFQGWITDAGGPKGFAASNGLVGSVP
ncbi:MAG TPA: hypothetical protein VFY71_09735 [Planctomycetota bacterium]|nr:hypothetical protein [Planctomycetota bacterium]